MSSRWAFAGTAAVVRAFQKDAFYRSHLESLFKSLLQSLLNWPLFLRIEQWLPAFLADVVYFGAASIGTGNRSLGEEYAQLLPVDSKRRISFLKGRLLQRLLLAVALSQTLKSKGTGFLCSRLFPPKCAAPCEGIIDALGWLHLAVFYWNGRFPTLMHRLLSIRFIYYPQRNPMLDGDRRLYQMLAGFALSAGVLKLSASIASLTSAHPSNVISHCPTDSPKPPAVALKCPVCIGDLQDAVASSVCGHVCCAECLLGWMESRNGSGSCPVCRMSVQPVQLVPLANLT